MDLKVKLSLKKGLTLFFGIMSFFMFGQHREEKQIQTVFDQLVLAYGSSKTAPELVILQHKQDIPAFFKSDKKSIVSVDKYLFTICRTFGKDSLNALSIVISHELAHYYNEHNFCTDFAFAIRNKNEVFSKKGKLIDKNQKIIYETQADDKGMFYAAISGYEPFEVQSKLIDAIYTNYQLKDEVGYPTKAQRKEIAKNALLKAKSLYEIFALGLKYIEEKDYDRAISSFNTVNSDFPSRENYNNLGLAKTRQALNLKVASTIEKASPERFLYPLEIENKSRLNKEITRGDLDDTGEEIDKILKEAQKNFQEAIRLDPNFTKGYINLACVSDLLGNYPKSIGTILDLSKENQNTIEAKRILAIAYFHNNQNIESNIIWRDLKM